jgi:DNA gyrase/topoisomerase IV subunit B
MVAISALLINFLYKYWPDIFERKMVYKVETQLWLQYLRIKERYCFNLTSITYGYLRTYKSYDIKYKKRLAALVDDEYKDIINNPKLHL